MFGVVRYFLKLGRSGFGELIASGATREPAMARAKCEARRGAGIRP
jgi:hypothetical protein